MDWPAGEAAFVTGAAFGIGLGIARALVAAGAKVALADVDEGRLAEAAKELTDAGGTVTAVRLDVSDEKNWATAADRTEEALGPISLLCNVAGVNGGGPIEETPLKVWRWVLGVNVDGQFIGASTFLPRFRSRGTRAHILNTASVSGLVPMANVGAYTASKFAGVGFTMVLREELRDSDVGVSLLIPGTVATRLNITAGEAEAKLLGRQPNREVAEANHAVLAAGADPDRVGEQVVEAVRDGRFLIVTHREWGALVRRTHAEIEDAYEAFDGRHGPDATARMLAGGTNPVTA
ncbi:SDR family NAD(P)-dependent oxidoreductase [Streptomyces sp. CSDS2]|uniref:SDR family NAD(P)-dependent oxidoreductase n=1 Tax=Streptomyces sp. CSDS2 TaxID=3055051 RepID=UPI0025B0A6E2|nr:SDR family NAD(P)-dependent oxidoreductase [Streptomyces sp. CSDS2]MDN3261551.1 SDR family NAD(P)-dependent oxidoreductase [Streptomyces sp. CSDS2]